jgi:putative MATE family efflux protein
MNETPQSGTPLFSRQALQRLLWPLVGEQFLAVTIGMADTVMVASAGEAAVSAVSLVDSINILMLNIFAALATGGAIVASQYLGQQDEKNANRSAKQLVVVVAVFGLVLGLLCAFLRAPLLRGLFGSADTTVLTDAQNYFFFTALSYPFIAIYNSGAAIFRSMGNSKVSLKASLISNAVNIIGNAICIYGLGWGVVGAAVPTLFARMVGAVLMLWLLRNRTLRISLTNWREFRLRPEMVRRILGIGVPNGLESGMFQIGKILVQGLIASLGTVSIAANAVCGTLCALPQIPAQAIGLGMTTVVGQCVGAGDYKQAQTYIKKLTIMATMFHGVLCMLFFFAIPWMLMPFGLSAQTVQVATRIQQVYYLVGAFTWALSFTFPNGLRAAGDVKFTMTASVLSMWIFRIGFSYLLVSVFHLGVYGVWYAMYIDWAVRIVAFQLRYFSGKWKTKRII